MKICIPSGDEGGVTCQIKTKILNENLYTESPGPFPYSAPVRLAARQIIGTLLCGQTDYLSNRTPLQILTFGEIAVVEMTS